MTAVLALPDGVLGPPAADLTEGAVRVWPAAGPTHIVLAVLARQAVRVIEADLDADPGLEALGPGLGDAALPQGAVRVGAALLEADIPDTGVFTHTRAWDWAAVTRAAQRRPHTAVLRIRRPVPRNSWQC